MVVRKKLKEVVEDVTLCLVQTVWREQNTRCFEKMKSSEMIVKNCFVNPSYPSSNVVSNSNCGSIFHGLLKNGLRCCSIFCCLWCSSHTLVYLNCTPLCHMQLLIEFCIANRFLRGFMQKESKIRTKFIGTSKTWLWCCTNQGDDYQNLCDIKGIIYKKKERKKKEKKSTIAS